MTRVEEFVPSEHMSRDSSVGLLGVRRSGKTFTVRDLLCDLKFEEVVVMTGSSDAEEFYEQFVPPCFVYGELNESKLSEIISFKTAMKKKAKFDPNVSVPHTAIVLDDLTFKQKAMKGESVQFLAKNGRNAKFFFVVTAQYPIDLPPFMRGNLDVVFIFAEPSRDNRVKLFKYFSGCFQNFQEFNKVFESCTENGCCMVLNNLNKKSNRVEDRVFWYEPKWNRNLETITNDTFINFNKTHYRDEGEMYDIDRMGGGGEIQIARKKKKDTSSSSSSKDSKKQVFRTMKTSIEQENLLNSPPPAPCSFYDPWNNADASTNNIVTPWESTTDSYSDRLYDLT